GSLVGQQSTDRPTPSNAIVPQDGSRSGRCYRRRGPNEHICEVAIERIGLAGGISKRDISVRSEQIERIARKAGCLIFESPRKSMEWDVLAGAPCRQCRARGAIDMDLPIHRAQ